MKAPDRSRCGSFRPAFLILILAAFLAAAAAASPSMSNEFAATMDLKKDEITEADDDFKRDVHLLYRALQTVYSKHDDQKKSKELVYDSIRGLLKNLDPFSHFVEPKESSEMSIKLKGEYGGLGIVISIRDNQLLVVSPIEDTPAERSGVQELDKILEIDGVSTRGISLEQALKRMRGTPGTICRLTLGREGIKENIPVSIIRDLIKLKTVKWRMGPKADPEKDRPDFSSVGIMRITSFNAETADEARKAAAEIAAGKPTGLILDLRSNPGGLLNSAVDISGLFLPKGKLVVYTKGRIPAANSSYYTTAEPLLPDVPMVVLVNGGSASASEIVAGALKDHKRGILIGSQTFGKGSVQHIFPLFDSSSLVLTVARYFTPGGDCIHETGISPNLVIQMPSREEEKRLEAQEDFWIKRNRELDRQRKLDGETVESPAEDQGPISSEPDKDDPASAGAAQEPSGVSVEIAVKEEISVAARESMKSAEEKIARRKKEVISIDFQIRKALEILRLLPELPAYLPETKRD